MNRRLRTAQSLISLGCLVVLAGSVLHLIVAYPKVSAALAASNLDGGLGNALRSVFFMIGITWIAIAVVALIATFGKASYSKPIILFCGAMLLLLVPFWVGLMGWFVGNEMFVVAGVLIICGGVMFQQARIE